MVRKLLAVKEEGTECTMVDYADFNIQHTLEAQSLLFSSLANRFVNLEAHNDRVKSAIWVSKGMLNQWCTFPNSEKGEQKITQGMFSGCRATHFNNTTLNVAYFRYAQDWVSSNLNSVGIDLINVHQGDDVWISNRSRLWAIAIFNVMQASGLVFQPSKQLFDQQKGEFLRVVYTDQGCNGYVARAVNTLIVKPVQSADISGPAERATALSDQIQILFRRGMTSRGITLLWDALVPYAATSKLPGGVFSVPMPYLKMRFDNGGLDLGPPNTMALPSTTVKSIPIMTIGSAVLEESIPSKMAHDWVSYVSSKIKSPLLAEQWERVLHRVNITDSLRMEDKMECLRQLERDCIKWKNSLVLPKVTRNTAIYETSIHGEGGPIEFEGILDRLERGELPKVTHKISGPLALIFRAMASSPFKGLYNAMTATGLGKLGAAEIAISTNKNSSLCRRASRALDSLKSSCGVAVTSVLLEDIRTGGTTFQGEIHPVILTWVKEYALEHAVRDVINLRLSDTQVVKDYIITKVEQYIRSVRRRDMLKNISHY
nr:MAG: RNA dependent RNA polymerase [Hameenlinna totivirus 3]